MDSPPSRTPEWTSPRRRMRTPIRHNVRLRARAPLVDRFRRLAQKREHQWPKVKRLQRSPIKTQEEKTRWIIK